VAAVMVAPAWLSWSGEKPASERHLFPGTADHTSAFANTTVEESRGPC
jgi:hypothetical protein